MKIKYRFLIYTVFLFPVILLSQEKPGISEEELSSDPVNFINRSQEAAPYNIRKKEVEAGEELARNVLQKNNASYNERGIQITRIFDKSDPKFGADLVMVMPTAGFGHIHTLQRILAGYMMEAYGYNQKNALLLSRFILYYNAHNRGKIENIKNKYSEKVSNAVVPEKLGIDLSFKNWAGKTQLVIPLKKNLARTGDTDMNNAELKNNGGASTEKENKELSKIEEKRNEEDLQKLDEKEKTLTKEETVLKKQEEQIKKEETKINTEIKKSEEKITELKKNPVLNADQIKKEEQKKEALQNKKTETTAKAEQTAKQKEEVQKKKEEVVQQKQETKAAASSAGKETAAAQQIQKLQEENKQLKEEKKKEEVSQNVVGEKILFMRVLEFTANSHYHSELWAIDTVKDDALFRSPYSNICGREFNVIPDQGILVIGYPGDPQHTSEHHFAILDSESLTMKTEGKEIIFWRTPVKVMDGKIYAIEIHNNQYFLSRFKPDLTLDTRSETPVSSDSEITFTKNKIYLTGTKTGSNTKISVFNRGDMKHIKTFAP